MRGLGIDAVYASLLFPLQTFLECVTCGACSQVQTQTVAENLKVGGMLLCLYVGRCMH